MARLPPDRPVAIKVLSAELGAALGVGRFLAEIKVTANLQHPNLLPLVDSGGAAGCLGLVMRRRWAMPLLIASLAGLIVQDVALFGLTKAPAGPTALVLQGLVLLVAIALLLLARKATARGWIA